MINLSANINTIPLPDGVKNALVKKGFSAIGELLGESEESLGRITGVGEDYAKTIKVYFKRHGMVLGNSQKKTAPAIPVAEAIDGQPPTIESEIRRLLPTTARRATTELKRHFESKTPEIRAIVKKHPFVHYAEGTTEERVILVPQGRQKDFTRVMRWAEDRSFSEGGLSIADVIRRFDLQHNWFVNIENVKPLIEEMYDIVWLDRDYGWFWIRDEKSPLAHQAMMALSLAREMTVKEMKKALERWYRTYVQDSPLPHTNKAILGLCSSLPEYCFLDEDTIVASNDLKPVQVININPERAILKAFVDKGLEKELSFEEIKEACRKMPEASFMLRHVLEGAAFVEKTDRKYRLLSTHRA